MDWNRRSVVTRHGDTSVSVRLGEVHLHNPRAFSLGNQRWCPFAARAFSLVETESLEIDRPRGRAIVRYHSQAVSLADFMGRFSQALAAALPPVNETIAAFSAALADSPRFRLSRRGSAISSWELLHSLPGRLRVRDLRLKDRPETVRRLELALRGQTGILSVSARSLTGTLVLQFDTTLIDQADALRLLDQAVGGLAKRTAIVRMPGDTQWSMAQASLGVAVAGQFLMPALIPLSAALLLISNVPNFYQARQQLRRRQAGLPVLYVAIVTGTLATGGYIAASAMTLCLLYWQHRRGRMAIAGHHALSSAVQRSPTSAWCIGNGVEFEVPVANLQDGDCFVVKSGELVPADGRVVRGTALLDEPPAVGADRLMPRRVGQDVLAGSFVVDGELHVEVQHSGEQTLVETVSRALTTTLRTRLIGTAVNPPKLADRAVPPVLLTAGIGLLVGDATAAVAIMRPDYASGPQLGDDLTTICQIGECVNAGIVVRRPDVFEQLAGLDLLLFDHVPALEARQTVLDEVRPAGSLPADELLSYACCALREWHDPRATALVSACVTPGGRSMSLPLLYRAGGVEFCDQGRTIRVEDLSLGKNAARRGRAGRGVLPPLAVYRDGQFEGHLTFREQGYAQRETLAVLRSRFGLELGMLGRPGRKRSELAGELGFDVVISANRDESRAAEIRELVRQGRRVGYVGDPATYPETARAAHLTISIAPRPAADDRVSAAWLLGPDYYKLITLRQMAAAGRARSQVLTRFAVIPNVACIAGALLLGFTSLAAVLVTNIGTYSIYCGNAGRLRQMERRLMARRNRFLRHQPGEFSGPVGQPMLLGDEYRHG